MAVVFVVVGGVIIAYVVQVISVRFKIFQRAFNAILHCLVHENDGVMDRRCIKVFKEMLPGPPKKKEEWVSRVRLFSLNFLALVKIPFDSYKKYSIYHVTNTVYPIFHVTVLIVKFT